MLADGVIEPSNSPYSSPVVLIPKKDNKEFRFCVDYRQINAITADEPTPLPIIHETLRDIGCAKIFSTLDLKSGYWQIEMHPDSKQYTAFSTPDGGNFQFCVLPFGLKTAPSTFQKLMSQEVLVGYIRKFAMVYLDDVIVYSDTWEDHLRHLSLVFERLRQHHLTCAPEKCEFGASKIEYLGHIITSEGNIPQPQHLGDLHAMPPPQTRKQLRRFLGLCNWIRDYIPKFLTCRSLDKFIESQESGGPKMLRPLSTT